MLGVAVEKNPRPALVRNLYDRTNRFPDGLKQFLCLCDGGVCIGNGERPHQILILDIDQNEACTVHFRWPKICDG